VTTEVIVSTNVSVGVSDGGSLFVSPVFTSGTGVVVGVGSSVGVGVCVGSN